MNSDGTFDIEYADGDREKRVKVSASMSPHLLRLSQYRMSSFIIWTLFSVIDVALQPRYVRSTRTTDRQSNDRKKKLHKGSLVQAQYGGKQKWYPGTIESVHSDGTFDILYDDGDQEKRVASDKVRPAAPKSDDDTTDGAQTDTRRDIKRDDKVEARYPGSGKWSRGKVTKVRSDDTFDIKFDDGHRERKVKRDSVRIVASKQTLKEGDNIEARYRGKQRWYKGKVTHVNDDGTFNVRYDDGDKETNVEADMIRRQVPEKEDDYGDDFSSDDGSSNTSGKKAKSKHQSDESDSGYSDDFDATQRGTIMLFNGCRAAPPVYKELLLLR